MQRSLLVPGFTLLAMLIASLSLAAQESGKPSKQVLEPPKGGIHWARGHQPPASAGSNPDMTWHGGPILPTSKTSAIFWGTSWANSTFVKDKIAGLDSWYKGVGGSSYGATTDEYTGPNSTRVSDSITYLGHHVDTSPAPLRAPKTSAILNEVCKVIPTAQLVSNGFYAVYVDTPRKNAGYCAWHSAASCSGVPVQFAFFFNLDGDAGCDPGSNVAGESQGLAALANVTGHELSETRTDPRLNAWYDSSGAENADKCAWSFVGPFVTFSNGTKWKIQGNWSNYDYDHDTGYANLSGEKGCADGTNVPGPYTK
ncbi:MAG: hypothetical protein DMG71_14210 [Acidobacteria bacterium]|nr:MAG: hypothetical protein DMG71_14210 [Acidobacteriota bacterium]